MTKLVLVASIVLLVGAVAMAYVIDGTGNETNAETSTAYGATQSPGYYESSAGEYQSGNSTTTIRPKMCKPKYVMPETTCCGECKPGYPGSFGQYWMPM